LVTLPDREEIRVHLDNPNAILVEEVRTVTLQKGSNQIDFSWKGVSVDKGSITLKILSHPDKVRLIAFSYPNAENAVIAILYADEAMEEKIRFAYLLSGISTTTSYRGTANREEKLMSFLSEVKISNESGEDFVDARISTGYGTEYTRSLQYQEQKKMVAARSEIPIKKEIIWDARQQPHDPGDEKSAVGIPVYYIIENKESSGLGKNPLRDGKVRLFQEDSQGTDAFLGEDWGKFTAVGDRMEIHMGDSRDLIIKRKLKKKQDKNVRRNFYNNPILIDREENIEYTIENFKDKPMELIIRDYHTGYWEILEKTHDFEKKDSEQFEFKMTLPAKGKETIQYTIIERNIRP
jgi:hypothetical protein